MNILNNDFIILNKSMLFISNIDNLVSNIPRSNYFYKDKIITCSYNLIEYIFRANYSNDKSIKDICLREILVNISLIDKLLERFYKKKYISEKQMITSVKILTEVNKMVRSWLS